MFHDSSRGAAINQLRADEIGSCFLPEMSSQHTLFCSLLYSGVALLGTATSAQRISPHLCLLPQVLQQAQLPACLGRLAHCQTWSSMCWGSRRTWANLPKLECPSKLQEQTWTEVLSELVGVVLLSALSLAETAGLVLGRGSRPGACRLFLDLSEQRRHRQ